MSTETQISRLLSELTKQTATGQLSWTMRDVPDGLARGTDDFYPAYYETIFKGQRVGIAQRRYQSYDGEHDKLYWSEKIVLLFRDPIGRVTWETSSHYSALENLLDSIRVQTSNLDTILNQLVGEDDEF